MGNYLRIYKNLEEFKANTFNLPYPCVSVVDDDTIETDEEIVEFEELDKIKCKLEIPSDVVNGKEEVQVAKFNNLSSVEAYSTNADNVVFVDVPKLIETEKEIQFTFYGGIYVPSYEDSVLCASLTYEMHWKASRPINETDYLFMAIYDASTGDIGDYIPLQYNDFMKTFVHHGNNEYGFSQETLNEITNSDNAAYIAYSFAFVDAEFVEKQGVELPKSVTTTFPKKEYEGKYVATEITEFSNFTYNDLTLSLPIFDYAQPISSITTNNRWSVNRELYDTDYCVLVLYADSSTISAFEPIPVKEMNYYITSYGNLEYGLSQPIISELRQAFPSASINLYFVDKDCIESNLSNQPTTINTSVMSFVIDGGLTSINVKTNELDENGVAELNLKVTNDFDNISFVNKQYLKSFDGSRYGLDNIKEISNNQFESSDKLEEFIIPNGVETIGDFAFNNCFSLSSVTIPESVTEIGAKAFRKCVFLSENFINQSSLDAESNNYWKANVYDVIQEDGLCIRGTSVWGCRPNSSGVTIPDYITRIEENAFIGCTNLKRVDMPNSIKYIGKNAFRYCINVEKVVIPESVEEIASDAFTYCFFDLDIFENKSNINAKDNNYWQALICKDGCVSCCGVLLYIDGENIIIHDGIKVINADAVRNRESIKSITIPSSVTSIGINAFYDCSNLTSVTIPSSVTSIGASAFKGCYFQRDNFIYNGSCNAEFNNWWGATLYDIVQDDGLCISGTTVVKCRPNATNVTIPDSVTSIGDNAFENCTSLTSVTIPDSVTSIYDFAFNNCSSLTSVTIPSNVTSINVAAFQNCTSLISIEIPDSVTSIGRYAFYDCRSLASIVIPDRVTTIGESAFSGCGGLTSVAIPDSVTSIDNYAFYYCSSLTSVTIGNSVTTIGHCAFWGCKSLTSVTIPNSVTTIYSHVFRNCTSLTSIVIPDSVTSIGNATFMGCTSLSSITICRGITKIGMWDFQDCTSLTSVTIPDNITYICNSAFRNCTSLKSVVIPDSVIIIGSVAFYDCSSLTSVVIPDSVTTIDEYAFWNCKSLTSVTIPDSVTNIGYAAFYGCTSLTSVTIPSSVTSIDDFAFGDCYFQSGNFTNNSSSSGYPWKATICDVIQDDGLCISGTTAVDCIPNATHVTIPDSVKTIGAKAFNGCSSLTSIVIPNSVTTIGSSAFTKCSSLTSVTIPNSITSIASNAFEGCYFQRDKFINNSNLTSTSNWGATLYDIIQDDGLCVNGTTVVKCRPNATNVTIPDSVTSIYYEAFSGCTSLTSVEIPSSVTSIGHSAFQNCTSLTSVTIPDSVTSIAEHTFQNCTSLTSVTIPDSVTSISSSAFNDTPFYNNLPNGDVYLGRCYYKYKGTMPSNTSITIKDGTKSICSSAFYNCSGLTSVTIPNSVTTIGESAFSGCYLQRDNFINNSNLTSTSNWGATLYDIIQEDGLFISGTTAIKCRPNATHVTIPDSVTSIGDLAFSGCTNLSSVTILDSVTTIGESAFSGCCLQRDNFINNSNLTSTSNWGATLYDIVQEDGLFISGTTAIKCRPNATHVTIPDSVTTIDEYAFSGCTNLSSVTIPNSVTSIGSSAFTNCTSLSYAEIGNSVTSIGKYAFHGCSSLTSITIPNSVTSIGKYAFYGCSSLKSVTIGSGITRIDNSAFYGCSSLTSIVILDSVTSIGDSAFKDCSNLTSIVIPDSVTSIGNWTFYGCTSLTSVTIPSSVKSIDYQAFYGCSSLTSIVIPDSVIIIVSMAFYGCSSLKSVTIGSGITRIDNSAFYGCTSLTSVTIPSSVTRISSDAFNGCYFQSGNFTNNSSSSGYPWKATICDVIQDDGLCISGTTAIKCRPNATHVTIPSSVTSISSNAFSGCYFQSDKFINNSSATGYPWGATLCDTVQEDGLFISGTTAIKCKPNATHVTIPSSVTSIGASAFSGCTNLSSVTIPSGVTSIGEYAFKGCSDLTSIEIPDSVTSIGSYAFTNCMNLGSVTIPSGVTSIGSNAFYNCISLASIVIPDSVTSIDSYAFYDCRSLASIVIPDRVTTIGESAFSGCGGLTSVAIPDSVTSIDNYAFYYCSSLTSVTIPDSVTSIGASAFSGCENLNGDIASNGFEYFGKNLYKYIKPNINNKTTSIRYGCVNLTSGCLNGNGYFSRIEIPSTVTTIGDYAFSGCTSLTSVTIPDSVTSIGTSAFTNCTSLSYAEIGNSVTTIGYYAFSGCTSLNIVSIGSSVKSIGSGAFSDCTQLDEVYIKEGLEAISSYAFSNSQLGSITLPSTIKSIDKTCFNKCDFLHEIICYATIAPTVNGSFIGLPDNGTLYVLYESLYSSWKSVLPSGWVIKYLYEPKECTNLVITANDVNGRKTNTQIIFTATTNGINTVTNEVMNDVIITGVTKSQSFEQNTSYTDTIEREITFEYFGVTASTTITQGVWFDSYYSIDLKDQWRMSSAVTNPDGSLYDGVYESFSNYNVNSSSATCVVTINGYSNFKFYIRSNGENNHDYVDVYDLDGSSTIKATTKGIANSDTTLSSYKLVEFTNLDGGEHTIKVVYRKDSSSHSGTDRGYLMIPYNQDV